MIRVSTQSVEGQCPVSMWLSTALYLSAQEMQRFIESLGPFFILKTDTVIPKNEGIIKSEDFLAAYKDYITALSLGEDIDEKSVKKYFQSVWTLNLDTVYSIDVDPDRHIIKLSKPSIILQHHKLHYSDDDQKFRSMVLGLDAFTFGIQISYPQLYQDPKTHELKKILLEGSFVNTDLYKKIKQWVKTNTRPISFLIENKKVTLPYRIGKEALAFVNHHPWIVKKHFKVI